MQIRKLDKATHKPNDPSKKIYNGYARRFGKPISILIHSTNSPKGNTSFEGEVNYLYNSSSVASDYIVGEDEVVELLNPKEYYTFHAGYTRTSKYINSNSIGIEVHYSPKDTEKPINPAKIENLTALVKYLLVEYNLTPNDISMHRWEAVYPPNHPKAGQLGRKVDPSFWTDTQFLEWRATLTQNLEEFTVLQQAFIYTDPTFTTKATHINDGEVVNGLLPVGYEFEGQWINNNQAIWMGNGWGFVPPYAVESDTILNGPQVDPIYLHRALNTWAKHLSTDEKESIVTAYTAFGELTTIGNLYPFVQAAKETAWFSSERWVKSKNPAGLGATNDGAWGSHFNTPAEGILAQYAHLLAYATKPEKNTFLLERLAQLSPRLEAMSKAFGRGSARTWKDLNGKWAFPGNGYGESIIKRAEEVLKL